MATAELITFAMGYRFSATIGGRSVALSKVGPVDVWRDHNGNMRPRPVTIETAHKKGEPTLTQLFKTKVRKDVVVSELDQDGMVIKRILLKACALKGFHIDGHDATDNSVVTQGLKLHPKFVAVLDPKVV